MSEWLTISCKYTMVIKNDNSDQRGHNYVSQLLQGGNHLVQGFCCCFVIPTSRAAEEKARTACNLRRVGPLCPEGLHVHVCIGCKRENRFIANALIV